MRILIVEDDPEISSLLAGALQRAGHHTVCVGDGLEGEREAVIGTFGLVLLDVMLPGQDGVDTCRKIRSSGVDVPILMLTARDTLQDKVTGLDAGADDYLVKPFATEELLARVRALGRRESANRGANLIVGDVELDTLAQTATRAGKRIELTPRELSLLEALMRNSGRVLTRETILERVWNNDQALPNTVNFHMSSLRKKIDPEGTLIHTVHGTGFRMEAN